MKTIILTNLIFSLCISSCAIEFQVASQRTAIEEQILGAYEEMDQNLVLMSSVRAIDEDGEKKDINHNDLEKRAAAARQNQQFNMDDLTELKKKEIVGESLDGTVTVLSGKVGKAKSAKKKELDLADYIVKEENRDRRIVWQRVIEKAPDLKDKDINIVKENYHKQMLEKLAKGMWHQNSEKKWVQKK